MTRRGGKETWPWVITYADPILGRNTHVQYYFDVHQGYSVSLFEGSLSTFLVGFRR